MVKKNRNEDVKRLYVLLEKGVRGSPWKILEFLEFKGAF